VRSSRPALILFALLMLVPLPFLPEFGGANSSTRIMLTAALVEEGSTRIDRHAALTVDKAEHDGHFYSDKAPGMALLAVPVYIAGRALDGEAAKALFRLDAPLEALPAQAALLWRMVSWLTGGLLMALAGAALYRALLRLGGAPRAALLASVTVCLATPVLGWSVQFFGHVGAGAALALAFALSTGLGHEDNVWLRPGPRAAAAAAALSLAVSIEYTAAPPALMVAAYALWRLTRLQRSQAWRLFGFALAAALLAALPMLAYHQVTFGSIFRVGYAKVVGFEGMQQGFLGLSAPDPVVLWRILFGFKRGLLWLSPVLVFVPLGLWWGWRKRALRAETALSLVVIAYYFLLNASYFYWNGGASVGPRHTMPAMFFMALPLMLLWQQAAGRLRQALAGLFALSLFFSIACAAMTMTVTAGWRFPLKDPILENLLGPDNAFARMAAWGLSPAWMLTLWLASAAGLAWVAWRHTASLR
jgi:hypothetical protein